MDNVHKQSSSKQSCIHPPRQPKSHHPLPKKYEGQLRRQRQRRATSSSSLGHHRHHDDPLAQGDSDRELGLRFRSALSDEEDDNDDDLFNAKTNVLEEVEKENYRFRSMSDFYESIPDYNDLHHLSEAEFYSRLDRLKIQQQELMDLVVGTTSSPRLKLDKVEKKTVAIDKKKNQLEPVPLNNLQPPRREDLRIESTRQEEVEEEEDDDEDCNSILSLESVVKPDRRGRPTSSLSKTKNSKKSVRISSGTTYRTDFSDVYDDFVDENLRLNAMANESNSRSKSVSPRTRLLTIPKPFKMTQREEEEKMLNDMASSQHYLSKISINFDDHPPVRRPKIKPFKASPVPLTSRIPLYEHIKEDHRRKSALAKLNSAIELQAQIKPFKFASEKPNSSRCLSRAMSTPNLSGNIDQRPGSSSATFKASPCPKNLFSNYFYNKLWEDDYFRALNRKIRAEEMLKISNLPPSMAKRAESAVDDMDGLMKTAHKSRRRKRKCKKSRQDKNYEFTEPGSQRNSRCSKRSLQQSASSIVSSSCGTTPVPTSYPVNRPNLAATLRVQSARQKVRELAKPKSIVPENRLTIPPVPKGSSTKEAWGVKKAPAWRSMNYDPSNMEDIALRLATRRAEQRLRQEEHEISMELMRQRVRAAPLLLEGPTYWGPKVGQVSHHCRAVDPFSSSAKSPNNGRRRNNSSKLSFYSVEGLNDRRDE